jgi:hypothetical protein
MSELNPFILKSLRKMRAELISMQKDELCFQSLNDLLPKYRDGLVASGAYNPISQMQSGQQYVTDVDQLDAVRRETIKMVEAAITALESQQQIEPAPKENIPTPASEPPAEATQKLAPPPPRFFRSVWDEFRSKSPMQRIAVTVTVFGFLGTAMSYFHQSWLTPALKYFHIEDRNSETVSIFVDCHDSMVPRVFPANGRFYVTTIHPSLMNDNNVYLALGFHSGPPGAAMLPPDIVQWAQECALTNYGSLPIFNIVVPIRVTFREAHHPPNQTDGWQSGPVKVVKTTSLPIAKIDAGKDSPFVFYLTTQSHDFVELEFLDKANLQEGSDKEFKTGRLIVSVNSHIQFSPNEPSQIKSP